MGNFKVYRSFDEFLKDPNLSLRAKGFLTMVLTNNITTGFEVENYCTDTKEDIKELASLFRNMMGDEEKAARSDHYPTLFKEHFTPMPGFRASYRFQIEGMDTPLALVIDQGSLNCDYADLERAEVDCTLEEEVLGAITKGQAVVLYDEDLVVGGGTIITT